jgi:hypothetical protein
VPPLRPPVAPLAIAARPTNRFRPHSFVGLFFTLGDVGDLSVFGIDWLSGIPIAKETSVLDAEAEVVAETRRRASYVAKQHPGKEPDSFRLTDATGRIHGVFPVR